MLNRNITVKVNWILENLLFPIMHECRWFMYLVIWFAYGKYTKYIMEFKDKYPDMTDEEINHYYELIVDAPINKKRMTDLNQASVRYILSHIKGHTVLDAACGRCYMLNRLINQGYKAVGVDVAPDDKYKKRGCAIKGSLIDLPFENCEFDTVICTHALEHIRDYRKAIRELIRVTGKRLIIVMPRQREYKYTPDLHVNFCPYMYRFKSFLKEGGLVGGKCFSIEGDWVCVYDKSREGV